MQEKYTKTTCDTICKPVHINLIYVLAISTRAIRVLTE